VLLHHTLLPLLLRLFPLVVVLHTRTVLRILESQFRLLLQGVQEVVVVEDVLDQVIMFERGEGITPPPHREL